MRRSEDAASLGARTNPREVVERYVTMLVNDGDSSVAQDILAEDCRANEPEGELVGRRAILANLAQWREAFPGMRLDADDLIVDRDRVVWQWRLDAVHVSGRPVDVRGTIVFRVRDGRIVEYRGAFDRSALERQLRGS